MKNTAFAAPRQSITGAVFMIGIAILFATDWFWPGILALIGITSLVGAFITTREPDADDIPLKVDLPRGDEPSQAVRYAPQCASCGAATPPDLQDGAFSQESAECSFCGSPLIRAQ